MKRDFITGRVHVSKCCLLVEMSFNSMRSRGVVVGLISPGTSCRFHRKPGGPIGEYCLNPVLPGTFIFSHSTHPRARARTHAHSRHSLTSVRSVSSRCVSAPCVHQLTVHLLCKNKQGQLPQKAPSKQTDRKSVV